MNLWLDVELWLRRHGLWPLLLPAVLAVATLATLAGPEEAPAGIAAAVDVAPRQEASLRAFRGVLIPRTALEARQQALLENALRYGLTAGRIDYGYEDNAAGRFGEASLHLPLHGNYSDLRRFLAAALAAEPALALAGLTIQRDTSGHGVDARLRFVFHVEPATGARG